MDIFYFRAKLESEELNESDIKKLKDTLAHRYSKIEEKNDNDNHDEMAEITKEEPQVKWDCESIISKCEMRDLTSSEIIGVSEVLYHME